MAVLGYDVPKVYEGRGVLDAASMGIDRMGSSRVSRIREPLDVIAADPQARDLPEVAHPHVWLDAACVKCRDGGHVPSRALVTAMGVGADGCRRLLGLDAVDAGSHAGWLSLLRSLRGRGVGGAPCVTSDAHGGLRRAIVEGLPGSRMAALHRAFDEERGILDTYSPEEGGRARHSPCRLRRT